MILVAVIAIVPWMKSSLTPAVMPQMNDDRVLYTDNWYTSMKLAKLMFVKYGWTICGTITPTDKKSREDETFRS